MWYANPGNGAKFIDSIGISFDIRCGFVLYVKKIRVRVTVFCYNLKNLVL